MALSCLQAGAVRRQEANAQLQLNMETEVQKLSERMAGSMRELQLAMKSSLEQIGRSIHELTAAFPEEREQRKADIEHVGSSLCARLDDTVAALDEERFARLEQERESLRRCGTFLQLPLDQWILGCSPPSFTIDSIWRGELPYLSQPWLAGHLVPGVDHVGLPLVCLSWTLSMTLEPAQLRSSPHHQI